MKKISALLTAWTAVAILVTATGCATVSNLHSSSSVDNQDNTIIDPNDLDFIASMNVEMNLPGKGFQ